jgi:hypothetical protein
VKIENPAALSFILHDDVYLLNADKAAYILNAAPETTVGHVLKTPEVSFNYLGSNKKQFLILVYYPGLEFMAAGHQAALESTLNRLKFDLDDVAVFNRANYPDVNFEALLEFFKPQLLLILGKPALPGGMAAPLFNKTGRMDTYSALFTFSFDEMMDSNENKKIFWEQIKQLQ